MCSSDLLAFLGWLKPILDAGDVLLEFYHDLPSLEEWRDCVHKQSTWHRLRRKEHEKKEKAFKETQSARKRKKGLPPLTFPALCVISAGRPDGILDQFQMQPLPHWPTGFYGLPLDYLDTWTRQVAQLQPADVRAAFQRKLVMERMITVVVGAEGAKP